MSCPDWRRLDPAARDADARPTVPAAPGAPAQATEPTEPTETTEINPWESALRHLDSGCPRCWQEAVALDPTLIFRRLPVPELSPAQEAEEVEAARLAVTAMRTASRVGRRGLPASSDLRRWLRRPHSLDWLDRLDWLRSPRSPRSSRSHQPSPALRSPAFHAPRLHAARAQRAAMAAGLTAMALVYGSAHEWHSPAVPATRAAALANSGAASAGGAGAAADRQVRWLAGASPTVAATAPSPGAGFAPAPSGWPAGAAPDALPAASRSSIGGLSRPRARVYQLDGPHMSVVMIVDDKLDV
jgi:hypothetical protein